MNRRIAWVDFTVEKLGELDALEHCLAVSAAGVLASQSPYTHILFAQRHDTRCAAAVVAIVEIARTVARGGDLSPLTVVA